MAKLARTTTSTEINHGISRFQLFSSECDRRGIPGFDPDDPATFDPFQTEEKGVDCTELAIEASGNPNGFIKKRGVPNRQGQTAKSVSNAK